MENTAPLFVGSFGFVITDPDPTVFAFDSAYSVLLQPDGKIVLAGYATGASGGGVTLVRYDINGGLDTTFGTGGIVLTPDTYTPGNICLQGDGKIVVIGHGNGVGTVLERYSPDGNLDITFGGNGIVTASFQGAHSGFLQADGKIIVTGVGGRFEAGGFDEDFSVARYNDDGTLDSSFGVDGVVETDLGTTIDQAYVSVLQSDGKLLVGGHSGHFAVVRYNSDQTLDTTFDGDGIVTTSFGLANDYVLALAVQADGKIVAAGHAGLDGTRAHIGLARYNVDGGLDTTFGVGGKVVYDLPFYSMALQPDGKIVVASQPFFTLIRFNADGAIDTTFGVSGSATADDTDADSVRAIVLAPDGKIIAAGGSPNFAVGRFLTGGSLDIGFASHNTLDNAPIYTQGGFPLPLDPDVQIGDAELAAQGNYGGATITLARHGGANGNDVFSNGGAYTQWQDGDVSFLSVVVGTVVANSSGTLSISFNNDATQEAVNYVLQSISYSNNSDAPPPSVEVDWEFSDGNTGGQGSGTALSAIGSTVVTIHRVLLWSRLSPGEVHAAFDSNIVALRFDDSSIYASAVGVESAPGATSVKFSYGGKTVTIQTPLASLTTTNVLFANESILVVGDNTTGITNDNAANTLTGGNGSDHLIGLGGADHLTGGANGDRLDGGPGYDTAHYDVASGPISANLEAPWQNTNDAQFDSYVAIEALVGSAFGDTLVGNADQNGLSGGDGNDYLQGRNGNDSLGGGNGNDELEGGPGADSLAGGAGFDYAKYKFALAAVTVDLITPALNTGEAVGDLFNQVEGVIGSRFDDQLYGNALANDLAGLDGNDLLFGRAANDNLQGGNGDDTLDGGAGMDRLAGSGGNDTFVFHKGEANGDTIVDFDGNGALPGDQLVFQGYGLGATFTPIDATHWRINSLSGPAEVITIANGAAILPTDYTFV